MDNRLIWILLVKIFGPGNARIWDISANFDNVRDFYASLKAHEITSVSEKEYEAVDKFSKDDAQNVVDYCVENGINICCFDSDEYPRRLKYIANPPAVLFSYGDISLIDKVNIIAFVGTRMPCEYSIYSARVLSSELIKCNITLASGFATGIDQIANTISLDNNIPTVAVCGTAVDHDYPENTIDLKKKIAENGVVISELIPGSKPVSNAFKLRNRILVGVSKGVIFIEASMQSHGLDNYIHATAQGKPVFVLPPRDITDSRFFGQRYLIRNGCIPVFNAQDVVGMLSYDNFESFSYTNQFGDYSLPVDDSSFFDSEKERKTVKKPDGERTRSEENSTGSAEKTVKHQIDYGQLNETETAVCKVLEKGRTLADNICTETGIDISTVLSALTLLELEGIVNSLPGNQFELAD